MVYLCDVVPSDRGGHPVRGKDIERLKMAVGKVHALIGVDIRGHYGILTEHSHQGTAEFLSQLSPGPDDQNPITFQNCLFLVQRTCPKKAGPYLLKTN